MTSRLSALLIPLALAGCATFSRASADGGLRARMYHSEHGVAVSLSEPAHVAIFAVVPGDGVFLFYPGDEGDPSRIAAGRNTLSPTLRRRIQMVSLEGEVSPVLVTAPRREPLLYMVASRQPLDDAVIRNLQEGLGGLMAGPFRSNGPSGTMAFLASLVVPGETPETEWDTDVMSMYRSGRRYAATSGVPFASPPGNTAGERICRGAGGGHDCLTPAQEQGQRMQGNERPGRP
jgi:hypothetical protein